jgi:hypothetical protein
MMERFAIVWSIWSEKPEVIATYLPGNYKVLWSGTYIDREVVVIRGEDDAGWTLDNYVLPRLASGLHPAEEIDSWHGVWQAIVLSREQGESTDG